MSLVIGFMAAFLAGVVAIIVLTFSSISSSLVAYTVDITPSTVTAGGTKTSFSIAVNTIMPLFHGIAPLLFLLYICVHKPRQEIRSIATSFTAPPSRRVSLPTDTAAHAPNFLSPSTAEPTEEIPLIIN